MWGHRSWFIAVALVSLGLIATPMPVSAHAEPADLIACTGPGGGATVAFVPPIDQRRQTVTVTSTNGVVSGCTGSAAGITRATFRTTETATVSVTASCTDLKGSGSGSIEVTWYQDEDEEPVGKSTITMIADMANLAEGKDLLTGHVKQGTPADFNGGWLTGTADLDEAGYQAVGECAGENRTPIASLKLIITALRIVRR